MPPRPSLSPESSQPPVLPQGQQGPPRTSQSSQSSSGTREGSRSWSLSRSSRSGSTGSKTDYSVAGSIVNSSILATSPTGMSSAITAGYRSPEIVQTTAERLLVFVANLTGTSGNLRTLGMLTDEQERGVRNFAKDFTRVVTMARNEIPENQRAKTEYFDANEFLPQPSSRELREKHLFDYAPDVAQSPFAQQAKDDVGRLRNALDIYAMANNGRKVYMRALLDTQAESNFIRRGKVDLTGELMRPYRRQTEFFTGDGRLFRPIGEVNLTWGVNEVDMSPSRQRTWDIRFLVMNDNVPYDMILGYHFIENAGVFRFNAEFCCPLITWRRSKEDKQAIEEKEKKEDERRSAEENEKQRELLARLSANAAVSSSSTQSNTHQGSSHG